MNKRAQHSWRLLVDKLLEKDRAVFNSNDGWAVESEQDLGQGAQCKSPILGLVQNNAGSLAKGPAVFSSEHASLRALDDVKEAKTAFTGVMPDSYKPSGKGNAYPFAASTRLTICCLCLCFLWLCWV